MIPVSFSRMLHSSAISARTVCGRMLPSARARDTMSEAQTSGRNHLLAVTLPSRLVRTYQTIMKIFAHLKKIIVCKL